MGSHIARAAVVLLLLGAGCTSHTEPAGTAATATATATAVPPASNTPVPSVTPTMAPTASPSPVATATAAATSTPTAIAATATGTATPTTAATSTAAERIRALTEDESWELPGLTAAVHVVRTEGNVPHIYAHNRRDLSFVHGFLLARDRFFMIDLTRRLGPPGAFRVTAGAISRR